MLQQSSQRFIHFILYLLSMIGLVACSSGGGGDSESQSVGEDRALESACDLTGSYITFNVKMGIPNQIEIRGDENFYGDCERKLSGVKVVDLLIDEKKVKNQDKKKILAGLSEWTCVNGTCNATFIPGAFYHANWSSTTLLLEFDFEGAAINGSIQLWPEESLHIQTKEVRGQRNQPIPFEIICGEDYLSFSSSSLADFKLIKISGGKIIGEVEHAWDLSGGKEGFRGTFMPDPDLVGKRVATLSYQLDKAKGKIYFSIDQKNTPLQLMAKEFVVTDGQTLTLKAEIDYRDDENDKLVHVESKNVRGGSVGPWSCDSRGDCTTAIKFSSGSQEIVLDLALSDQKGGTSNFSEIKLKRPKFIMDGKEVFVSSQGLSTLVVEGVPAHGKIELVSITGGTLVNKKWDCAESGRCVNQFQFRDESLMANLTYRIVNQKNGQEIAVEKWLILPIVQKEIVIPNSFQHKFSIMPGEDYDARLLNSAISIKTESLIGGKLKRVMNAGFLGIIFWDDEWSCFAQGFCLSLFLPQENADVAHLSFNVLATPEGQQSQRVIAKGEYLIKIESDGPFTRGLTKVISAKLKEQVPILLSAQEMLGDQREKYQVVEVQVDQVRGGQLVEKFSCQDGNCTGQFQVASTLDGAQDAGVSFHLVAQEKPQMANQIRARFLSSIVFQIIEPPLVTPAPTPTPPPSGELPGLKTSEFHFFDGVYFAQRLEMESAVMPVKFEAIDLPDWIELDPTTGQISGIPPVGARSWRLNIQALQGEQPIAREEILINVYSDPLISYAWHLQNDGISTLSEKSGTFGADINVAPAYRAGLTGKGIKINISDSGMQLQHPDLKDNIDPQLCRNYAHKDFGGSDASADKYDPIPRDGFANSRGDHGTSVAGLAAAVGWNGIGSRGVAPKATLAGNNYISYAHNPLSEADQALANVDISNQSWGLAFHHQVATLEPESEAIYLKGVQQLRLKRGVVYIKSAGNGFSKGEICNTDPLKATPWMVVVGALNGHGYKSSYSTPGPCLWVSAPGGEYGHRAAPGYKLAEPIQGWPAMVTTDVQGCDVGYAATSQESSPFNEGKDALNSSCDYTSTFNGTSSAAPVTSGAVALILERNPLLSWRDVKHILAQSAKKVDRQFPPQKLALKDGTYIWEPGWVTNSAGYNFHNWYGFGAVDVGAAIILADPDRYRPLAPLLDYNPQWVSSAQDLNINIPDFSIQGAESALEVTQSLTVESVQVEINFNHNYAREIAIELISPAGTKSILMPAYHSLTERKIINFRLLSNAFYGESAQGKWTLRYIDTAKGETGTMGPWRIRFYGHHGTSDAVVKAVADPRTLATAPAFHPNVRVAALVKLAAMRMRTKVMETRQKREARMRSLPMGPAFQVAQREYHALPTVWATQQQNWHVGRGELLERQGEWIYFISNRGPAPDLYPVLWSPLNEQLVILNKSFQIRYKNQSELERIKSLSQERFSLNVLAGHPLMQTAYPRFPASVTAEFILATYRRLTKLLRTQMATLEFIHPKGL